ncbi:MAG: SDR family oxidoreductase [Burkholderiales bacterium]|nr:SDR family oxidoreductase [Burkholderiales bacterium]
MRLPGFTPAAGYRLLIVGGCGGIGRALVAAAVELGIEVSVLDLARSIDAGERSAGVEYHACDVTDEAQVRQAFAAVAARWQRIDGLVNLAGYTGERIAVKDMSAAEWDAIVDASLRGSFLVAREAAPLLAKSAAAGAGPAALFISSTFGVRVQHVGYAPYAAAKAGVINLVRALATEWAPAVRVNGIAPGVIDTPFLTGGTGRATKQTGIDLQRFTAGVPLGRLGQPREIAAAALFLLSDAAAYVHGQTLHVNGGSYMA